MLALAALHQTCHAVADKGVRQRPNGLASQADTVVAIAYHLIILVMDAPYCLVPSSDADGAGCRIHVHWLAHTVRAGAGVKLGHAPQDNETEALVREVIDCKHCR